MTNARYALRALKSCSVDSKLVAAPVVAGALIKQGEL